MNAYKLKGEHSKVEIYYKKNMATLKKENIKRVTVSLFLIILKVDALDINNLRETLEMAIENLNNNLNFQ